MLTILAVGEDSNLLKSRADVLRKTGANVLCSSGAAALKFMKEWEFDLIVLCHSVPQREAKRITEAAHQQGSKTLVLLLVSDRVREQAYEGIRIDARSFVEPDCLIRNAAELLSRQQNWDLPATSPARKRPQNYPADIAVRRALIAQFENRRAG